MLLTTVAVPGRVTETVWFAITSLPYQGSPSTGAIGATAPRFSNLHLEYVSLGTRIASRLPTLGLGIKKLSLSYHMHGFQEDVSQDN